MSFRAEEKKFKKWSGEGGGKRERRRRRNCGKAFSRGRIKDVMDRGFFFKGRRNFVAYRRSLGSCSSSSRFFPLSAKQQERADDCPDSLFTPDRFELERHFYFRPRVEIPKEYLSGFGGRNSMRKSVTIGRVFDSRRNSIVERENLER